MTIDWWMVAFRMFVVLVNAISIWYLWVISPSLLSAALGLTLAVLTYLSIRPNAPERLWALSFAFGAVSGLLVRAAL